MVCNISETFTYDINPCKDVQSGSDVRIDCGVVVSVLHMQYINRFTMFYSLDGIPEFLYFYRDQIIKSVSKAYSPLWEAVLGSLCDEMDARLKFHDICNTVISLWSILIYKKFCTYLSHMTYKKQMINIILISFTCLACFFPLYHVSIAMSWLDHFTNV